MAYTIDIYDKSGTVVSNFALDETLFDDSLVNKDLIHEYYLLQQSNARHNIACVKGRGEVHGSGRKLYKQKGTGGARPGDKQSPVRKGGGVSFGPRGVENYTKSMNKKARKIALNSIITLKAKAGELMGLQNIILGAPKTKDAQEILKNVGIASKKVLLVVSEKDENLFKSFRNLPKVKYIYADYLNPTDLMSYHTVLFLESALATLNKN
ncbi:MAG TPA: 50S ribosomal protein L4 [Candidatus Absconditabacterales bacterium]|nr:50S ribosomal protein L4 [Candidatus Absconditabacterales bacterium]